MYVQVVTSECNTKIVPSSNIYVMLISEKDFIEKLANYLHNIYIYNPYHKDIQTLYRI